MCTEQYADLGLTKTGQRAHTVTGIESTTVRLRLGSSNAFWTRITARRQWVYHQTASLRLVLASP